ncbi:MAG: hypothetical protein IJV45_01660 [Prevotella sp.]|nr:hypothetical protein [Prevotella sp.]
MKQLLALILLLSALTVGAGGIDDIRQALETASSAQVQEKVYIHTDNQCYFVGDTLWYKAYVVRADNLQPTDMSRLLYVELLSPDGLLVERQTIVVAANGYTCGQFALQDSLYSGYYELRAYTRWMLNFNVREHRYSTHDTWLFYNRQMAADYFRVWDGLYSRVLPVYSKPDEPGDYDARRMYQRPKTRLPRVKKDDLVVTFYPEGGHLVEGVENRVAFEVSDQHGEAVSIAGTIEGEGMEPVAVKTEYMGRGSFTVTPNGRKMKARFSWRGKEWSETLPQAGQSAAALCLKDRRASIKVPPRLQGRECALSVLCRGRLVFFQPLQLQQDLTVELPYDELPTGVNDLVLFDADGQILADRLFFVNHHDYDAQLITSPIVPNHTYAPYEHISVPIQLEGISEPTAFSVSIHDTNTDEPTYDDGNLMTDLLLSSELRGFIAHPAHYFEADDDAHRRHLDLLMMVQGWRKYKWTELAQGERPMRYEPEKTLTIEGSVYRMLNINPVEPDEVGSWQDGVGLISRNNNLGEEDFIDPFGEEAEGDGLISTDDTPTTNDNSAIESIEYGDIGSANDNVGVNHGNLRREVLVEAEIALGDQVAGSVQKTEQGRFLFQVPPFYGDAYLNMKAYAERDSLKKNMASRKDATALDEDAFPDYYVKRDLFYPMFTHDYTFYEKHMPDYDAEMLIDTLSELSMENDVHQLGNINVKGHRRGRRAVDWHRPAFVLDAYDLYNEITDRGLSFGKFDARQFPVQVCRFLYGNMNRYNSFHVDGRIDGATFYRNYSPVSSNASEAERAGVFRANRTSQSLYRNMKLKRLQDIRVFSDYEPRTEDSLMVEERYSADATVELVTIPDDAVQPTFRDRHILLHGVNAPEQFYQPDYGRRELATPADYRRTLYWNPNAVCDSEGRFTATFYNNGKETRLRMTAAGVSGDGRLLHSK